MIGSRVSIAHIAIRTWLRDGGVRPGEAINVKDTADALRLSVTPIREALERLVGERLVIPARDRSGFIMPRHSPRDFAEMIDLHAVLADVAVTRSQATSSELSRAIDPADSRRATETFFESLFLSGGGGMLADAGARLAHQLAPFRLVESHVLLNDASELIELAKATSGQRPRAAFKAYHRRRALRAVEIVQAREDLPPNGATLGRPDIVQK